MYGCSRRIHNNNEPKRALGIILPMLAVGYLLLVIGAGLGAEGILDSGITLGLTISGAVILGGFALVAMNVDEIFSTEKHWLKDPVRNFRRRLVVLRDLQDTIHS